MRTLLLVIFFLSRHLLLSAQEDLTVLVTNLQNQPIPQAQVQLKNSSRGLEWTRETDAGGKAVFRSIPAVDGYQLFIPAMLPYEATNSDLIDLRPNQSRLVQIILVESTQNLEAVTDTAGAVFLTRNPPVRALLFQSMLRCGSPGT